MEYYLGSLLLLSFGFAPRGAAVCNGQLLPINQNQALFSLLGTTYGGNGTTTFALPNLAGRCAMHFGNGHSLGERAGQAAVTLTAGNLPQHLHSFTFAPPCNTSPGTTANPQGNYPAATTASTYGSPANVNMGAKVAGAAEVLTGNAGGSQPISVEQPYLVLNYCIALQGIFPSRN